MLALTVLIIVPLSTALVEDKAGQARQQHFTQSIPEAMREAFAHRGYMLLCTAYTVCGFQLMFISVHFPAYLLDQRMTAETGMAALALIGLFNIFGSYAWGWLGGRYTKKYLLSLLYFTRAVAIALFIAVPLSPLSVFVFAATIGFLWLGTVPLTSGVIAHVFGVQYLSTLTGVAFFFHQVGSFLGVLDRRVSLRRDRLVHADVDTDHRDGRRRSHPEPAHRRTADPASGGGAAGLRQGALAGCRPALRTSPAHRNRGGSN